MSGTSDTRQDLAKTKELLWGPVEPSRRGPRPGLTLERNVDTAIAVADAEGIDALSMRRVAAELGVGTMSLYRYVPGKAVLLNLMLDRVSGLGDCEPPQGEDWRSVLEAAARGTYQVHLRHRWLLQVNWSRPVFGPNTLAGVGLMLNGLADTGLTDQERAMAVATINGYCTGMARSYVQYTNAAGETGISDEEFWTHQLPILESAMATGRYPALAAMAEDTFDADWEETFEFGLQRLLDGLAALIEQRRTPADNQPGTANGRAAGVTGAGN